MFTGGDFDEQPDPRRRELLDDLDSIDLDALSKAERRDLVLAHEERARLATADLYKLYAVGQAARRPVARASTATKHCGWPIRCGSARTAPARS